MNPSSSAAPTPLGNMSFGVSIDALNQQYTPSHQPITRVRTRRDTAFDNISVADGTDRSPRQQGDSELASRYANALEERTRDEETVIPDIPPYSSFGQWRTQLRQALEDKGFLNWLQVAGYSVSTLEVFADGSLSVARRGQRTRFTLQDDSPWATFAGPIMDALKAYAPEGIKYSDLYADNAPLTLVAQFYGETIHKDSTADRQRARELKSDNAFATTGVGIARSDEALAAHKRLFASKRDLEAFTDALAAAIVNVERHLDAEEYTHNYNYIYQHAYNDNVRLNPPAYDRSAGLLSFLQSQQIKLDPDSGFQMDQQSMAGRNVNLLQFMTVNGWDHPLDRDEMENMRKELVRPVEYQQRYGNFGGGLSWPTPLDLQQQKAIYNAVSNNSMGLPAFDKLKPSQNAFDYLTQTTEFSDDELKDPRQAALKLLRDPAAKAMGEALRSQFEGAGSADDWTLSALQIGLNQAALGKPDEKNKMAGFDLSAREHWGKPLSFVVEKLTEHLRKSYGKNAPVATYLLLAHHAPELLLKDDKVTYGSPPWVSWKAIVAKANMRTPGLSLVSDQAQLLAKDRQPITAAERQVEALAGREGLIHWAVADGAIAKRQDNNYTDEEIERASMLANERLDALAQAAEAQGRPLLNFKAMALNALKERFPEKTYGPIDFEKKAIWPSERHRDLKGPYSILDIHLNRQREDAWLWYSNDPAVPFDRISKDLRFLPSVKGEFEKNVIEYYDGLKGAMQVTVKHLMSLLPEEDKEALHHGALKIYAEEKVTQTAQLAGSRYKYVVSEGEDVSSQSIFVETVHKGIKRVYEVDPTKGVLRRREDLVDGLKVGLQGKWQSVASGKRNLSIRTNTKIIEVKAGGTVESKEREPKPQTSLPVQAYSSSRTQHIADAVTQHFFRADQREKVVSAASAAATTFDTEVTEFEKIQAVTRTLIPFASAAHSFQNGRVNEGLTSLAFDIFGFAWGGGSAIRGLSKLVKSGVKVGKAVGTGAKVGKVARGLLSAANPFAGGTAILSRSLPLYLSTFKKGVLAWKVISANLSVNRLYQHRPKNVVQGTSKDTGSLKINAQLDEITGKWYRFDSKTNKTYGMPLQEFAADPVMT